MIEITFKNKAAPQRHRGTEVKPLVLRVTLCLCASVVNGFDLVKATSMNVISLKNKTSLQRHRDTEVNQYVLRVTLCLCASVVNAFSKGQLT
jgi:hypothetical protein